MLSPDRNYKQWNTIKHFTGKSFLDLQQNGIKYCNVVKRNQAMGLLYYVIHAWLDHGIASKSFVCRKNSLLTSFLICMFGHFMTFRVMLFCYKMYACNYNVKLCYFLTTDTELKQIVSIESYKWFVPRTTVFCTTTSQIYYDFKLFKISYIYKYHLLFSLCLHNTKLKRFTL